jgi:hypothetical protein
MMKAGRQNLMYGSVSATLVSIPFICWFHSPDPCSAHGSLGPCAQTIEARKDSAAVSVREFSPTSAGETGREGCSPYKMSSPCSLAPYLPGRGLRAIKNARGLDQWPALHLAGALVYHLPKWESGRRNLCLRGYAFARPLPSL